MKSVIDLDELIPGRGCWALTLLLGGAMGVAQPPAYSVAAFDCYARHVEERLATQHLSRSEFVAVPAKSEEAGTRGKGPLLERLSPAGCGGLDGMLLEHWRGTAFICGRRAEEFERLLRATKEYPLYFAPRVLRAADQEVSPTERVLTMRLREEHVLTVVLDGTYTVRFGALDPQHRYSTSRSIRIHEIRGAGTPSERPVPPEAEHGWLWRLNTYWTYEESDGGLYVQVETVSLSRSVPRGLNWLVGPYVESIPRDSLVFTLRSVCNALTHPGQEIK